MPVIAVDGLLPDWLNGLSPPVLFFFLGAFAALVRSNLRIPSSVTKLLSLYLLWAIGFRGGVELLEGGLTRNVVVSLAAATVLAALVPVYTFYILRRKLDAANAAALCATYGSISAITFMTAASALEQRGVPHGGHMVAAMALMESPAIVIAVLLLRRSERGPDGERQKVPWSRLLHEAFLNGPVLLLLGSLFLGLLTGQRGYTAFKPLCTDLFSGVLVFFLLDLGLIAARRMKDLRDQGVFMFGFAIVVPLFNGMLAIVLAKALALPPGDSILLAVLGASASYIAVPAAMRLVVPEANPGLYIPMALGVTFPFNIAIGIPLYTWIVLTWWT
ncbi:MAG: sodium-dependent bicarbonate transport family permease [Phycisphaerae bacterium]|nr:sodium-dependent bicarbonate transport family permease [Phycisphaerae bacterium]